MSDTGDTYDSGYTTSYEVTTEAPAYEEVPTFDPGVPVVETDSYSYNSTDYGEVAEVSGAYMEDWHTNSDISNDLYQESVDAYLAGDSLASYDLNQASLAAGSDADAAWQASGDVWTSMEETTTVSTYESVDETSYADTSSYVDTSSYSEPVVDTSYVADTSYVDTSYAADPDL